jgi:hypothetical protein
MTINNILDLGPRSGILTWFSGYPYPNAIRIRYYQAPTRPRTRTLHCCLTLLQDFRILIGDMHLES